MTTAHIVGRVIRIRGTVQGVGFRPWVYRIAHSAGIAGRVWNDASGVAIQAFGDEAAIERFAELLRTPPPAAQVAAIEWADVEPAACDAFTIVETEAAGPPRVSIPPDLATCPDCLSEVFDPHDRRYRYPFTNCTNCGPRFTIATDIPYDRVATTMAPFEMCEACRREYHDANDRRFHAQPNACPVCGPQLTLLASDGESSTPTIRLCRLASCCATDYRGREGSGRVSPRMRCHERGCRASAPGTETPRRKTAGRHGPRPCRGRACGSGWRSRTRAADVGGTANRPGGEVTTRLGLPRRSRPTIACSGSCCRIRRCITCCSPRRATHW